MKKPKSGYRQHVIEADEMLKLVLASHLWIERLLIDCLRSVLSRPDVLLAKQPSFRQVVDLVDALAILEPDFCDVLRVVNSVRNRFAHRLSYEATEAEIGQLLTQLRKMRHAFLMDYVPPSKKELGIALASIAGYLERRRDDLLLSKQAT